MAQTPTLNLGRSLEIRFENSSSSEAGQTKLVVNAALDTETSGPFVLTLEQSGHVLATGSCGANAVVYEGREQPGEGVLRECNTERIPAANIRTNQPVDIVLAIVDDATDVRTEIYRGTFPVIGFWDWTGMANNQPVHVEQRALRLDSLYGAGYVRQYMDQVEFTYVTTQNTGESPNGSQLRCKVNNGEWVAYEANARAAASQTARNRVNSNGTIHEHGDEEIVTQWIRFNTHMPIAVPGRTQTPSGGDSMDGAWTCEVRTGGAGSRVVQRELRFDVLHGYIQPNAIEAQLPAGRGSALLSIGFNPAQSPMIFDPALVRGTLVGRRLSGATSPVVAGMPRRATQPRLTAARAARGGRGRH